MKITFLGVASALSNTNGHYHSNALIEHNGKCLLIDCGSDISHSLEALGRNALDIDAVYVSHCHNDHIGGLEWLGYMRYFHPDGSGRPKLFAHGPLYDKIWGYLFYTMGILGHGDIVPTLHTYFQYEWPPYYTQYRNSGGGECFEWEGLKFKLVENLHVRGVNGSIVSYGLIVHSDCIDKPGIYISTDTCQIQSFLLSSQSIPCTGFSHIFHDCELLPESSGVHTHYNDLKELPAETKKKMWMWHYQPYLAPSYEQCEADGFAGMVSQAHVFEVDIP